MSGASRDPLPFAKIEEVALDPAADVAGKDQGRPEFIRIKELDSTEPIRPQPEPAAASGQILRTRYGRRRGSWLTWTLFLGFMALVLVGVIDWIVGLSARLPILGLPASVAAAALVVGLAVLAVREGRALHRLRDVEAVRNAWHMSDGEALRRLILRVGADLGETATARRAADNLEEAGPAVARRVMSRDALAGRDKAASEAVAFAARQGFVLVAASPSPALDALLLLSRAVSLLRDIAQIYGYRPGALALRSLALAAVRDAAAVAVADAFAQAAAEAASRQATKAGDAMMTSGSQMAAAAVTVGAAASAAGAATSVTGVGLLVGLPLAVAGGVMSLVGRTVGATGGAVGGGAVAAWRLYRFGLMVLVAARPVPFDGEELREFGKRVRTEVLRLRANPSEQAA